MIFLASCCYILHWQCMENFCAREFLLQTWRSRRVVKVANNLKNGHVHVLNGTYYCPERWNEFNLLLSYGTIFFWITIRLQSITIFKIYLILTEKDGLLIFYDNSNSYWELDFVIISSKSTVAYSKRLSLWYFYT